MIYLAADGHGYKLIKLVEDYLAGKNLEYENLGVRSDTENIKLEDMIPPVVKKIRENDKNKAILSCGTGIGVQIGINRFSGIRACLATSPELAEWSVRYDNCNVICLTGWRCDKEHIFRILDGWFTAGYDGDKDRLKMMEIFDTWQYAGK